MTELQKLLLTKKTDGIVRASVDVVKVCKTSESVFRLHMKPGAKPSVVDGLKLTLLNTNSAHWTEIIC